MTQLTDKDMNALLNKFDEKELEVAKNAVELFFDSITSISKK